MTRAVIKLTSDITNTMPIIANKIEGCAYTEEIPIAAFRYNNFGVIIHSLDILILNAGDETSAVEVITFLKDIVKNADEITGKIRTYSNDYMH